MENTIQKFSKLGICSGYMFVPPRRCITSCRPFKMKDRAITASTSSLGTYSSSKTRTGRTKKVEQPEDAVKSCYDCIESKDIERLYINKEIALSILQKGKIPQFLGDKVHHKIFTETSPKNPCLKNLQTGLTLFV